MSAEKFCLRWNDFENNISCAFKELKDDKVKAQANCSICHNDCTGKISVRKFFHKRNIK